MTIRPYTPDDAEALAQIYRDAVTGIGATEYNPRQIAVWASFAEDIPAFRTFIARGQTMLVDVDGEIAAYCQLHPADHIALLYTATRHARRGYATAAYLAIETEACATGQRSLTTDASKLSRPFFEKQGFVVCRTEQTFRQGEYFERYQMTKSLSS
jgi:putative acetyltransferase